MYTFIFLSTAPIFIPSILHFADITTSQSCPFFFHFSVDPFLVPVLLSVCSFLCFPVEFSEWWLIHYHPVALCVLFFVSVLLQIISPSPTSCNVCLNFLLHCDGFLFIIPRISSLKHTLGLIFSLIFNISTMYLATLLFVSTSPLRFPASNFQI